MQPRRSAEHMGTDRPGTILPEAAAQAAGDLLRRHQEITKPTVIELLGLEWDLLPGVYAPNLTRSAALYAEWLPYPLGGSFCEIGCGMGYISVLAALRGCQQVAAVDINPHAVRNTQLNARRHGVDKRIEAWWWHMFPPLGKRSLYDVIFWNSNFVDSPDPEETGIEGALFDPGYESHRAFFNDAAQHLNPGGRLLLGFADLGNREKLAQVAEEQGWEHNIVRMAPSESPFGEICFYLVEFTRAGITRRRESSLSAP